MSWLGVPFKIKSYFLDFRINIHQYSWQPVDVEDTLTKYKGNSKDYDGGGGDDGGDNDDGNDIRSDISCGALCISMSH